MSHVRSINRVILVGRVGRNPEITVIASSGRELAKLSMVTNEGYYDQNRNWRESEEWHNITAWGPLAQRIEKSVGKGDMILVEGKIKTRKWKDQSGQDRKTTEIEAQNVIVLDRRNKEASGGAPPSPSRTGGKTPEFNEGEGEGTPPFDTPGNGDDFTNEEDPF